jgi:NADPH-dependent 2,4-dienoyl-CoA reductase/sulfur reductase-like enzyme
MSDVIQKRFDVVVVGGGPAGIAAATEAARSGASVALLDDNPGLGGQIWRGESRTSTSITATSWFEKVNRSNVNWIFPTRVFHVETGRLLAESPEDTHEISFEKLILATGARERFLPFPGWTLPNVLGAGGLQVLIKSGLPVDRKRIAIAGTGPLLLAVASCVLDHGGEVVCIAEQTTNTKFTKFGMRMLFASGKFGETLRLGWKLKGIPHWRNCWPVAALGRERVEGVRLSHRGRIKEIACDYLACGFHLIPNTELAEYLGCKMQDGFVVVDGEQQTSVPGVYAAGEPTGIGGLELALIEGQIAGQAAAGKTVDQRKLFAARAASQIAVRAMKEAFALRAELRTLAEADTLVCRCEDVSFGRLCQHKSWREAKLQTRCGMGPCQSKVCGPATEFLFGWKADSLRPPLSPVRCSSLAAMSASTDPRALNGGAQ